jgi:hypothetical protein
MAEGLEPGDVVTVDFEYDPDDSRAEQQPINQKPAYFHQIGTTEAGVLSCGPDGLPAHWEAVDEETGEVLFPG